MAGINCSIVAGRLVSDPEIRYTEDELALVNFQLKVDGDKISFINCVGSGGLAKVCGEYLKKGRLVAVEGRLQIKDYTDKKGERKTTTKMVVENLQMLDSGFYEIMKEERG